MTTATATATAPKKASNKEKSQGEVRTFTAQLCSWQLSKKHKVRQWVILTIPFRDASRYFEAREYDITANAGEQRPVVEAWIRQLKKRMAADEFVPAVWSGCLRKPHRDKMTVNDEGTVTLTASERGNPGTFAHIDGNHRAKAMAKLRDAAASIGDQETMDYVDNSDVTIQVYLEPDRSKSNFRGLQEGRPVSKDLLRIQRIMDKAVNPEQQGVSTMALAVAMALNKHKDSHLFSKLAFGQSVTNLIGVNNVISSSASELACSIYGGALIATHYEKDKEWLEQCYIEASEAVEKFTQRDIDHIGVEQSSVLMPGKIMCRLGLPGGKKGGTSLVLGVGNMWVFMKAFVEREEATQKDYQHIADSVDAVFDLNSDGGLDAPKKRSLMGKFAATYFEPIVLRKGQSIEVGKLSGRNGVPIQLLEILKPSAFAIKKGVEAIPQDGTISNSVDDHDEDDEGGTDGDGE